MSANAIFIIIFVIFCGILIGAGLFSKRWVKESDDFVLAGREISTLINTVGVCAIGFAGTTVTLAPGFTIQYGLFGGMAWSVVYSMCGLLLFGGEVRRQRHGEQAALEPAGVMGPLRGESRAFGRRIRRESGESLRHPGRGQPFRSLPRLAFVNPGRGVRSERLVGTAQNRERNPQYNQVKQRQTESVFCIYLHEAPFAFWVAMNDRYGYGQEAS